MISNATTDQYVGVSQAAMMKGVRRQTVLQWIEAGRLPAVQVGRVWAIRLSDVLSMRVQRQHNKVIDVPAYLRDAETPADREQLAENHGQDANAPTLPESPSGQLAATTTHGPTGLANLEAI